MLFLVCGLYVVVDVVICCLCVDLCVCCLQGNSELGASEQKVISDPDITVVELNGDTDESLLLCCDGLVERLTNEQLAQYVAQESRKTPKDPARK